MGKLWKYNAKALPEGTVRTWGDQQYKKEGGDWVTIKRGKQETEEKPYKKETDDKQSIDKDYFKIDNQEINKVVDHISRMGIKNIDKKQIEKKLKVEKLKDATKNVKEGDIVYVWDDYNDKLKDGKEYTAIKQKRDKDKMLGGSDLRITTGYIAGGLEGKAVLKKYYDEYLKSI